jgi:hypothetical protein
MTGPISPECPAIVVFIAGLAMIFSQAGELPFSIRPCGAEPSTRESRLENQRYRLTEAHQTAGTVRVLRREHVETLEAHDARCRSQSSTLGSDSAQVSVSYSPFSELRGGEELPMRPIGACRVFQKAPSDVIQHPKAWWSRPLGRVADR